MKIISHRGYWHKADEKNTLFSFNETIKFGFGTETDIRDYKSELVISHDIANENSITLDKTLQLFSNIDLLLALNIKADGLQQNLQRALLKYNITNYFVFDMSIPDTILYLKMGFNVFGRQSEYEQEVAFYDQIKGVWLDAFNEIWYDLGIIQQHLNNGKQVCIVSSDLHKRNHIAQWELLKSSGIYINDNLILCTDYPEEAKIFFEN